MPEPIMRPLFAAFVLSCLAGAAHAAEDRPPPMPLADATVLYDVHAQGHAEQRVRVYFGRHGDLLRSDGPNGVGDTVLDRTTGTLTVVMNDQRAFMVIPSKGPVTDPFLLDPADQYRRAGSTQTIAGLACEDWLVASPKGHAKACVTAGGLLLAASGVDGTGASGEVRALSASTAALPPDIFAAPAGYQRIGRQGGAP